jgi:hypothetical protein
MLGKFRLPPMLPGFTPRYNIAPSQEQWAILLDDRKGACSAAAEVGARPFVG